MEPLFAIYPVLETYQKSKDCLIKKRFSLNNIIDKNWNINYISVENSIHPLDENLVSLVNINGPIDIEKLMKFY